MQSLKYLIGEGIACIVWCSRSGLCTSRPSDVLAQCPAPVGGRENFQLPGCACTDAIRAYSGLGHAFSLSVEHRVKTYIASERVER